MSEIATFLDRYEIHRDGTVFSTITNKPLRGGRNSKGYLTVSLYDGSVPKKPRSYLIHRLVAEAYLGKAPEDRPHINHKNGNKLDNRAENLEYTNIQENNKHAREVLGHDQIGEKNARAKLTDKQIQEIKESSEKSTVLAARYGITRDYVRQIIRGVYRARKTTT